MRLCVRGRNRASNQSGCRRQRRGTSGVVTRVNPATGSSLATWSGRVRRLSRFLALHPFLLFHLQLNSSRRSLCPRPAAHLKSKKHQGHVKKKRRSDRPLAPSTAPPAAPEATEGLSAATRGDAHQEASDGRSSHVEEPATC